MTRKIALALAASAAVVTFAAPAVAGPLLAPDHIVIVMAENKDFDQIVGNAAAPFINNQLIPGGLLLTNSHGIEHPSQPNYFDFFAGSNLGINSANGTSTNHYNFPALAATYQGLIDGCNAVPGSCTPAQLAGYQAAHSSYASYAAAYGTLAVGDAYPNSSNFNGVTDGTLTAPNLAASLRDAGKSFVEYSDGLAAVPGATDANGHVIATVVNDPSDPYNVGYAHRHDPIANWISDAPTGNQLDASFEQDFGNFLAKGADWSTLPTVSFVVPDTIHDMHDGAVDAAVANGDAWLSANLSDYLNWAKTNNSLLIVTTDENDFIDPSNQILTVINGDTRLYEPGVSSQYVDHFGVLRTILDMYGAGPVGASVTADRLATNRLGQLAAVPEPASWAMMVGGFALLGGMARRRRLSLRFA